MAKILNQVISKGFQVSNFNNYLRVNPALFPPLFKIPVSSTVKELKFFWECLCYK